MSYEGHPDYRRRDVVHQVIWKRLGRSEARPISGVVSPRGRASRGIVNIQVPELLTRSVV